jgi:integrase
MPRTAKNPNIANRTQRAKLPQLKNSAAYWHLIAEGQHLGYCKTGDQQGTWRARYYTRENGRRFQALGSADDTVMPNGTHVLSFQQALDAANAWIASVARADGAGVRVGPYTVADAAHDWLESWRGSERGKLTATANIEKHILPTLGTIEVAKLTRIQVEHWLHAQAKKAPLKVQERLAAAKKLPPSRQSKVTFDPSDPETQRKRKDSANRVFRDLRALLNRAYDNQHVGSKAPWDTVREFESVNVAKNEYLTLDEANRFMTACAADFHHLVRAALITGCRYGELCGMKVGDYDTQLGAISLVQSKTGKMKRIFLTPEEAAFFARHIAGKQGSELMFRRADGLAWGKSHQQPRMETVLKAAGIERHIRFHDLRHTFATLLVMNGTSMELVADQLGHSGTRMALKHYAHFSPAFVASTVRANKPSFASSVAPAPGPVLVSRAS